MIIESELRLEFSMHKDLSRIVQQNQGESPS
jgi:hypothetical protein